MTDAAENSEATKPLRSNVHRRQYQTRVLFAERPFIAEDGIVAPVGGRPKEQFWLDSLKRASFM